MKNVEILKRSFFCVLAYKIYFIYFQLKALGYRIHEKTSQQGMDSSLISPVDVHVVIKNCMDTERSF